VANSTKPLTNTQVDKAKAKAKEYNLSDGGGLQLRIKPNGSKTWLLNYTRPGTTKRTNMKIGDYPDIGLADARLEREKYRSRLAKGFDPQEIKAEENRKRAEKGINTFKHVAEQWLKVHIKKSGITDDYADDIHRSLVNHVFPALGKRPIHQITPLEAKAALEPLEDAGKLETLGRICQRINKIMSFAQRNELIEANRLQSIAEDFKAHEKVHYPTIAPTELPALMEAIENARIKPVSRCLILWQLNTAVRSAEAAGAKWDEVDYENKLWNIPKERMKKRRAHTVPLSTQALKILEEVKPFSENREFIFPSYIDPRKPANSSVVNMALKRMGYHGKLVAHGFRSIFSTLLHERAFDSVVIESALAHVDKNTTRDAYNNALYLEKRREMMQFWSNYITAAQTGDVLEGKKHLSLVN